MESHRWHIDVEHLEWPGYLSLSECRELQTNLLFDVLVGSHKFNNKIFHSKPILPTMIF